MSGCVVVCCGVVWCVVGVISPYLGLPRGFLLGYEQWLTGRATRRVPLPRIEERHQGLGGEATPRPPVGRVAQRATVVFVDQRRQTWGWMMWIVVSS